MKGMYNILNNCKKYLKITKIQNINIIIILVYKNYKKSEIYIKK